MQRRTSSLTALAGVCGLLAGCAATGAPANKSGEAPSISTPAPAKGAMPVQKTAGAPPAPAKSSSYAASGVELCPKMAISNSPPADANGVVRNGPYVKINGVSLLLEPATNACLSSGYGQRNGRPNRGVDYHTWTDGDVLAAANGTIIEAVFRSDFGNMIVIDHGAGVFTRYAHLQAFVGAVKAGATVSRGQKLGPIGSTGSTSVKHLHFEILTGKYVSGVGSFGLASHDPFAFASAKTAAAENEPAPHQAP
jgi:murein DD-endopeptidase MepM/ murein hydrolase activator NlpD